MRLELDGEERDTLEEVLHSWLSELSVEIAHTDTLEFREGLKEKRRIIEGVLARLGK